MARRPGGTRWAVLGVVIAAAVAMAGAEEDWKHRDTEHLRIFYRPGSYAEARIDEACPVYEQTYRQLAKLMPMKVDARYEVYLHDELKVAGYAEPATNRVHYLYSKDFRLTSAHEMMHLALRELNAAAPGRFEEGLCRYFESRSLSVKGGDVEEAMLYQLGKLAPPEELTVARNFRSTYDGDHQGNAAAAVVAYLMANLGRDGFWALYRRLEKDGWRDRVCAALRLPPEDLESSFRAYLWRLRSPPPLFAEDQGKAWQPLPADALDKFPQKLDTCERGLESLAAEAYCRNADGYGAVDFQVRFRRSGDFSAFLRDALDGLPLMVVDERVVVWYDPLKGIVARRPHGGLEVALGMREGSPRIIFRWHAPRAHARPVFRLSVDLESFLTTATLGRRRQTFAEGRMKLVAHTERGNSIESYVDATARFPLVTSWIFKEGNRTAALILGPILRDGDVPDGAAIDLSPEGEGPWPEIHDVASETTEEDLDAVVERAMRAAALRRAFRNVELRGRLAEDVGEELDWEALMRRDAELAPRLRAWLGPR